MPSPEVLSAFSTLISFASILLVVLQLRGHLRQRKVESLIHVYDITRELISLGFDHPELFDILADNGDADPVRERRYLQLWLNQSALIFMIHRHGLFERELEASLSRELREFMGQENMRVHWRRQRLYYPKSFRRFVDGVTAPVEGGPGGGPHTPGRPVPPQD